MTGPETYIISIITRGAGHFAKPTYKGVSAGMGPHFRGSLAVDRHRHLAVHYGEVTCLKSAPFPYTSMDSSVKILLLERKQRLISLSKLQ